MREFYDWFGLNVVLFHLINSLHAAWWDHLMLTMTWLGDHERYPYYMAIALLLMSVRRRWLPRRNVVVFGVGYAVTALIVIGLKPYLEFPRPLLALGTRAVIVVGRPELHHSFPSGHATFSVLLAASLSAGRSRALKWTLGIGAALVCVSRVAVGAHFPADVVGGALIAAAVVAVLQPSLRAVST